MADVAGTGRKAWSKKRGLQKATFFFMLRDMLLHLAGVRR